MISNTLRHKELLTLSQRRDHFTSIQSVLSEEMNLTQSLLTLESEVAAWFAGCLLVEFHYLQFARLLELRHQPQNLLRRHYDLILQVQRAVLGRVVQEVTIVHHQATGVGDTPGAGVGQPVQSPHGGAVLQVEVGHWVESVASSLLSVEVPGAETHQEGLQDAGQFLGAQPFAAGDQPTEGVQGLGRRRGVCGLLHLLPLLLREEVGAPPFLSALAEESLEPRGEAWNRWQTGEPGHVRELALEEIRKKKFLNS